MASGIPVEHEPGVVSVLAPNASPFTFTGTHSWLIGHDWLTIIDAGPDDPRHLAALLAAVGKRKVRKILLTHSHRDHSGLAGKLAEATGAPTLAFGPSGAGISPLMAGLAGIGGGEGVDLTFQPDQLIADGQVIACDGFELAALHTPGHMSNHMVFLADEFAVTGDLVLHYASTFVSPPDGDLAQFRTSCAALLASGRRKFYPGHGEVLKDGHLRLRWLLAHRDKREAAVLSELDVAGTLDELTPRVYPDLPESAWPAAKRNLMAHLVDLWARGLLSADPAPGLNATWQRL